LTEQRTSSTNSVEALNTALEHFGFFCIASIVAIRAFFTDSCDIASSPEINILLRSSSHPATSNNDSRECVSGKISNDIKERCSPGFKRFLMGAGENTACRVTGDKKVGKNCKMQSLFEKPWKGKG
jgi:hypothetical protein